ncbi:MAG: histidine kinase dimerization/phospho-acceptor domain-containing protein, partial [Herbiconiux sp.]|nr:histidine kinase dimerization/phospho-acceptor domain-containing protein [Herbiconiux sp.]
MGSRFPVQSPVQTSGGSIAPAHPRGRLFVLAQLPLLLGTGFVGATLLVAAPAALSSPAAPGGAVVLVTASLVLVLVPWERIASTWLVGVAVLDIVGVALIRAPLMTVLPSAGLLAVFPILWLSYGFRRMVVLVALIGAVFVAAFAYLYRGAGPATALEWASVITPTVLAIGVALVASTAAERLRRAEAGRQVPALAGAGDRDRTPDRAQADDIREQFLQSVSHELRTPLTVIAGYIELLDDSVARDDAVSRNYLAI